MVKLLASWAKVPANTVCLICAVVFLGFHALLFTNVSHRLDTALKRVDKLETILANIIAKNNLATVEVALGDLSESAVRNILEKSGNTRKLTRAIRSTREVDTSLDVHRNDRRIDRLGKKVRRCLRKLREVKHVTGDLLKRPRRGISPYAHSKFRVRKKTPSAVFTVWGASKCIKNSTYHISGQTVVVGSEFLCLSDNSPVVPYKKYRTRNLFNGSVDVRGVKYGDIEDIANFSWRPPKQGRNNKTVPCVVCSRQGMSSTIVYLTETYKFRGALREYNGVLMSTTQTKQAICVTNDAVVYNKDKSRVDQMRANAVQLHAAEIDCNSVHCAANGNYKNRYRVGCSVMTI